MFNLIPRFPAFINAGMFSIFLKLKNIPALVNAGMLGGKIQKKDDTFRRL